MQINLERLAETEYHRLVDPCYVTATEFGLFYNHPNFPTRYDAHQLFKANCRAGQIQELLAKVDKLYAGQGLEHKKISGHDTATYQYLKPELSQRGWSVQRTWMMLWLHEPKRPPNPAIDVRVVDERNQADIDDLHRNPKGHLEASYLFHRSQDERVGGERIVAYIDGKPAASTGWHVVDSIARYRHVATQKWARNKGAATTMLHYVQQHSTVRAQDALTIFCNDDGPVSLYEQMGFVKYGFMWEFLYLDVTVHAST